MDDFENNGRFDVVYRASMLGMRRMHYFTTTAMERSPIKAAKAGLGDQLGGLNIIQTDYNNDGCMDILVLRGAWEFGQRKSLLRNNCDGTFTDVTVAAVSDEPTDSQTAVWVDINNDGLLDLFVGNEDAARPAVPQQRRRHVRGYLPLRRTSTACMFTKGVAAADYDNDG